jgi:hypothetical protein
MPETGLKIKAKTLRDEIIEVLQRAIILGERKPGEPAWSQSDPIIPAV